LVIVPGAGQVWLGDDPQAWWFHAQGRRQRQTPSAALHPKGWGQPRARLR